MCTYLHTVCVTPVALVAVKEKLKTVCLFHSRSGRGSGFVCMLMGTCTTMTVRR